MGEHGAKPDTRPGWVLTVQRNNLETQFLGLKAGYLRMQISADSVVFDARIRPLRRFFNAGLNSLKAVRRRLIGNGLLYVILEGVGRSKTGQLNKVGSRDVGLIAGGSLPRKRYVFDSLGTDVPTASSWRMHLEDISRKILVWGD